MAYNPTNPNGSATSANSSPVVIASDQATVPVSLASVPSHAVTNAGTFATQVDGAALTALQLIDDPVVATGAAVPAKGMAVGVSDGTNLVLPRVNVASDTASQSLLLAQQNFIYNGSSGSRQREIVNATNSTGTGIAAAGLVAQFDDTSPTSITENQFGNVRMSANRNMYVTLRDAAGNERGLNIDASGNLTANLAAGTNAIGKLAANSGVVIGDVNAVQSGTWTVQPGNTANTTPWLVTDSPATSGGLSIVTGSVGATATAIKASAGQLYGYHLFNTTAAVAYVQIFNVASGSVTLGTTSPTLSIGIPASGGVTVNFDKGIAFSTAISFACTTTRTGSTGATCDVNFFYK